MSGELDNRFSIDFSQINKDEIETWFDLDKYILIPGKIRIQKHDNILRSYFNDNDDFDNYLLQAIDSLHDSIPENDRENCEYKIGSTPYKHSPKCMEYIKAASKEFDLFSYVVVMSIINNEDFLSTRELRRNMAVTFFENLSYNCGVLEFAADRYNGILINKLMEIRKTLLDNLDSNQLVIEHLNESLHYLRDYSLKANNLGRLISDNLEPQISFIQNELEYYKNKLLFEKSEKKIDNEMEVEEISLDLVDCFEHTSKYKKVMELLVEKGLIQTGNYNWIDKKKANKTLLASLIKTLQAKGYFVDGLEPTNKEIVLIAKNTFSKSISIDTSKRAPIDNTYFKFIPLSSEI